MTLNPKSPACILYAAENNTSLEVAVFWLNDSDTTDHERRRFINAAKAVRDAALDEAAELMNEHGFFNGAGEQAGELILALKDKSP